MAEDLDFTLMATGQEYRGREGVSQMSEYIYRDAFDARVQSSKLIVADEIADFEGTSSVSISGVREHSSHKQTRSGAFVCSLQSGERRDKAGAH